MSEKKKFDIEEFADFEGFISKMRTLIKAKKEELDQEYRFYKDQYNILQESRGHAFREFQRNKNQMKFDEEKIDEQKIQELFLKYFEIEKIQQEIEGYLVTLNGFSGWSRLKWVCEYLNEREG